MPNRFCDIEAASVGTVVASSCRACSYEGVRGIVIWHRPYAAPRLAMEQGRSGSVEVCLERSEGDHTTWHTRGT